MKGNFSRVLALTLKHEGWYSNHPDDPGGSTMRGVTQRTYDAYRKSMGLPPRSVKKITDDELRNIYRRDYWDVVKGDYLPIGLDYATFDAAVNSGPRRAAKWLQRALGVPQDGKIGPVTIAKANDLNPEDVRRAIAASVGHRFDFMQRLSHWPKFKNGWTDRISNVLDDSLAMTFEGASAKPVAAKPSLFDAIMEIIRKVFGK